MTNTLITPPPPKPISPHQKFNSFSELHSFFTKELLTYFTELYKHGYFIWQRTGGYSTNSVNLLNSQYNSANNIDNNENNLLEYTLISNTLDSDGSYIDIESFGNFAVTDNNKQINVYLGNSLIFSSSSSPVNNGHWNLQLKVIRVRSNSVKVVYSFFCDNSIMPNKIGSISISIDLSVNQILKFTAIGQSSNDISQECLTVKILHI